MFVVFIIFLLWSTDNQRHKVDKDRHKSKRENFTLALQLPRNSLLWDGKLSHSVALWHDLQRSAHTAGTSDISK